MGQALRQGQDRDRGGDQTRDTSREAGFDQSRGNAAAGDELCVAPTCACGDSTVGWRDTGNLIGHPPVRDEESVPNECVVEDESVFRQRRATAQAMLDRQNQRTRRGGELMDADGNVTDYRYWFAKVYSFVTENELQFTDQQIYYYPSYVMASVAYFEQIYADNFQAFSDGAHVEEHWAEAFERCAENQERMENLRELMLNPSVFSSPESQGGVAMAYLIDLVHGAVDSLVASMQAHIRYDLPRAEAWVFNSYYSGMGCVDIGDFRTDFMSMAGVFDNAGRSMNAHMAEVIGLPVDLMPKALQDTAMAYWFDADMSTERADTWQRTEDLVAEGRGGNGPYQLDGRGQLMGDTTQSDNMSGIGGLSNESLRPSMDSSAEGYDDNDSRATVSAMTDAQLRDMPLTEKMRRIRGMISGATFNEDEDTILRLLRATAGNTGNLVVLVNGCDAWDILDNLNGAQYQSVRTFLRSHYYAHCDINTALRLVQIGIDGVTGAKSAELIGDIFDRRLRVDGPQLMIRVGRDNGGSGPDDAGYYRQGRDELLWQVMGWADTFIRQNYPERYGG